MNTHHHPLAESVVQDCALTTNRLADEGLLTECVGPGVQHGGVELDELEVRGLGARSECSREAVTGNRRWVGRGRKYLPVATGCHDHRTGGDETNRERHTVAVDAGDAHPCGLSLP